MNISVL